MISTSTVPGYPHDSEELVLIVESQSELQPGTIFNNGANNLVDFGAVNFGDIITPPASYPVQLRNASTHLVVSFTSESGDGILATNNHTGNFPYRAVLRMHNRHGTTHLYPSDCISCSLDLISLLVDPEFSVPWSLRTSYSEISSWINIAHYVTPVCDFKDDGRCFIEPNEVKFQYRAQMCTSVLQLDEPMIEFPSCVLHTSYTKEMHIWNRSESVLSYSLQPMQATDDSDRVFPNDESIVFQDDDTGAVLEFSSCYTIPSFASKCIRIVFTAKTMGKRTCVYQVKNLKNPSNSPSITCDISVDTVEEGNETRSSCPISLEGEDSVVDLIAVDPDDSEQVKAILDIGKCYCGYKNLKRYWVFNGGAAPVSLKFSLDHGPDNIPFEEEVRIEASEQRSTDVPSRSGCIQALSNIRPNPWSATGLITSAEIDLIAKDTTAVRTIDSKSIGYSRDQTGDGSFRVGADVDVDSSRRAPGADDPLALGKTVPAPTPSVALKDKPTTKKSSSATSNLLHDSADLDYDKLISWNQLREEVTGGKRRKPQSGTSRGLLSLSGICGRAWGDRALYGEFLMNQSAITAVDPDTRERALPALGFTDSEQELLFGSTAERRVFIGEASKAAKVVKAGKSYSKMKVGSYLAGDKPSVGEALQQQDKQNGRESATVNSAVGGDIPASTNIFTSGAIVATTAEVSPKRETSLEDVANHTLLSLTLQPQERRQILIWIKPSLSTFEEKSGTVVGDKLLDVSTDISMFWKTVSSEHRMQSIRGEISELEAASAVVATDSRRDNDSSTEGTTGREETRRLGIRMVYQTCVSRVSITPSIYNMGLCNVGEYRTASFEITNKSQLPALLFPVVHNNILEISEKEIRLQPNEVRSINVDYKAQSEKMEPCVTATFVNGYNLENSQDVEVKAINVDPLQVFLHTMFYKLITYNDQRQLQIHYEHALINRPNLRVFRIKNVHIRPLQIEILLNSKINMKLYLISTQSSDSEAPKEVSAEWASASALSALLMEDELEDMKWDAGAGTAAERNKSQMKGRRSFSFRMDLDEPGAANKTPLVSESMHLTSPMLGLASSWGAGDIAHASKKAQLSAHHTSGGVDSKMGAPSIDQHSSIVDALDVPGRSSASTATSTAFVKTSKGQHQEVSSVQGTAKSPFSSDDMELAVATKMVTGEEATSKPKVRFDLSLQSENTASAGQDRDLSSIRSSELVPRLREQDEEFPEEVSADYFEILQQFDTGGFPFSVLSSMTDNSNSDEHDNHVGVRNQNRSSQQGKEYGRKSLDSVITVKGTEQTDASTITSSTSHSSANNLSKDNDDLKNSIEERKVRSIQHGFGQLQTLMENKSARSFLRHLPLEKVQIACSSASMVEGGICDSSTECDVGTAPIEIAENESLRFALVFEPMQSSQKDAVEAELELNQVELREYIQIRLSNIDADYLQNALKDSNFLQSIDQHDRERLSDITPIALQPRLLPVLANAVRSEFVLIQKNLSFGRTLVGDKTFRVVTVVNRSSIPCIFSISKSGSISSGFLQIPGGRKGTVPPFSSKYVEFVFKPTLAGSFEETMTFHNVLNPANVQYITIKAKVSKTEAFVLSAVQRDESSQTVSSSLDNTSSGGAVGDAISTAEQVFGSLLVSALTATATGKDLSTSGNASEFLSTVTQLESSKPNKSSAESLGTVISSQNNVSKSSSGSSGILSVSAASIAVNLGKVVVGDQCEVPILFKIKNVTSKRRQFIVDATHVRATVLLIPFPADIEAAATSAANEVEVEASRSKHSEDIDPRESELSPHQLLRLIPFEPLPDVLQSVLSLRCQFQSEIVNLKSSGSEGSEVQSSGCRDLSSEERSTLEDSLEHYQQKLKIAIRKNKPDKISKYQLKINTVISALSGNTAGKEEDEVATILKKTASKSAATIGDSGAEIAETKPSEDTAAAAAVVGIDAEGALVGTSSSGNVDQKSEVAYHFYLEPDQERLIQVKVSFLPDSSYSPWSGYLPFKGSLQVFECKNEDSIKLVHFGAMVRSSKFEIDSSISFISDSAITGVASANIAASVNANVTPSHSSFSELIRSTNDQLVMVSTSSLISASSTPSASSSSNIVTAPSVQPSVTHVEETSASGNNNISSSKSSGSSLALVDWAKAKQNLRHSFLTTVAAWSQLPTQEVYPRHRHLPENVLPTSVKLVRAAKKRVMNGSISVASLIEEAGCIRVSIDNEFSASAMPTGFTAFNPRIHGPVKFQVVCGDEIMDTEIGDTSTSASSAFSATSPAVAAVPDTSILTEGADTNTTNIGSSQSEQKLKSSASNALTVDAESWINAGSKLNLLIQWHPSAELQNIKAENERLEKQLKVLGALKVSYLIENKPVGVAQVIPFIGVLEHKSNLRVSKYLNFETISAGSYRTSQINIANKSETDKLHYEICSEEVSELSRLVGKIDILSNQTGIVPRAGSKSVSVLFSATAPGKFEQKLWVRNISDSFDQKLVVIQSQVLVAQTDFVIFPDLEFAAESTSKYKPIDLGLIQIQSASSKTPAPIERENAHKLRIRNVSEKMLLVTAVSNLKSQCFIFADAECTQPAINTPLARNDESILYVVLHPVSVARASDTWQPAAATAVGSTTASAGAVAVAAQSGKSALSSKDAEGINTSAATSKRSVDTPHQQYQQSSISTTTSTETGVPDEVRKPYNSESRELSGGIKLIFFEVLRSSVVDISNAESTSDPTGVLPAQPVGVGDAAAIPYPGSSIAGCLLNPILNGTGCDVRKLFETAVGFRALVGTSKLSLTDHSVRSSDETGLASNKRLVEGMLPSLYAISYSDNSSNSSSSGIRSRSGEFELSNTSKVFPLNYRYSCNDSIRCIGRGGIEVDAAMAAKNDGTLGSVAAQLLILDSNSSSLDPGSKRRVHYCIVFPESATGLILFSLKITNTSTTEDINKTLSIFVDSGNLKTLITQTSQYGSDHFSELSTVDNSMSVDESEIFSETSGVGSNVSAAESAYIDRKALLPWMRCSAPIWLVHLENARDAEKHTDISSSVGMGGLPVVLEEQPLELQQQQDPAVQEPLVRMSNYCVAGARSLVLCEWKLLNSGPIRITLTPACDLPLTLSVDFENESGESRPVTYRRVVAAQRNRTTFPILAKWKRDLTQCGESFVLEPQQCARISIAVRRGAWLSQQQAERLGGKKRINSGRLLDMKGVVVFLYDINSTRTGDSSHLRSSDASEEPDMLPIASLVPISCKAAAAHLELPREELLIGRIRCGMQRSFEVAIDNLSDVDVPCALEGLPSWLRVQLNEGSIDLTTRKVSAMNSYRQESRTAEKRKKSIVKDNTALDEIRAAAPLHVASHVMSQQAMAARKLQHWLASDGESISGAATSTVVAVAPFDISIPYATALREESASVALCTTEKTKSEREDSCDNVSMSSNANPTAHNSDDGAEVDADGGKDNSDNDDDDEEADDDEEEDEEEEGPAAAHRLVEGALANVHDTQSSLDVNLDLVHLSSPQYLTMQKFMKNALITSQSTEGTTIGVAVAAPIGAMVETVAVASGDHGLHVALPRSAPNMFFISKRSRFWLKGVVIAPTIESQTLEHILKIKNLATSYTTDVPSATGQPIAEVLELTVRMKVDAKRAFDIIPAVDEALLQCKDSKHYVATSVIDRTYTDSAGSITKQDGAAQQQRRAFIGASSVGLHFCRIIPKPLSIPRIAESGDTIEYDDTAPTTDAAGATAAAAANEGRSDAANTIRPVAIRPKELNSHCRFSVKNNLEHSIRVEATVWVNPLFADIIDFIVKFQLTSSSFVELLPEEKSAAKIRVEPKLGSRLQLQRGSVELYPVDELRMDSTTHTRAPTTAAAATAMDTATTAANTATASINSTAFSIEAADSRGISSLLTGVAADPNDAAAVALGPVLLGSVRLSPAPSRSAKQRHGDSAAADPVALLSPTKRNQQDVSVFDIVGYLQAAPTSFSSLSISGFDKNLPPSSQPYRNSARASAVVAFYGEPAAAETSAVAPDAASKRSPLLVVSNPKAKVFIINPSASSSLHFRVASKSYRHAGMRLLLGSGHSTSAEAANGPDSGLEEAAAVESYDTVMVRAVPAQSMIPPSSSMEITLEIRPGDVSSSLKAADTLTANLPEIETSFAATAGATTATVAASTATTTVGNSIDTKQQQQTQSAALDPSAADAETAVEGEKRLLRSQSARDFTSSDTADVENDTTFTIACIPVEVWDNDAPQHPPHIMHAYLISRTPLPMLLTQPLSEETKSTDVLATRNAEGVDSSVPTVSGSTELIALKSPADSPSRALNEQLHSEMESVATPIAAISPTASLVATSVAAEETAGAVTTSLAEGAVGEAPVAAATSVVVSTSAADELRASLPPHMAANSLCLRGATAHTQLANRYSIDLGQQMQKKESIEWQLTIANLSEESSVDFSVNSVLREETSSWLTISQTGGVIPAGGSVSFLLYLSRGRTGKYFAYVMIHDKRNKSNDHVVSIAMEVVAESKRAINTNNDSSSALGSSGASLSAPARLNLLEKAVSDSIERTASATPPLPALSTAADLSTSAPASVSAPSLLVPKPHFLSTVAASFEESVAATASSVLTISDGTIDKIKAADLSASEAPPVVEKAAAMQRIRTKNLYAVDVVEKLSDSEAVLSQLQHQRQRGSTDAVPVVEETPIESPEQTSAPSLVSNTNNTTGATVASAVAVSSSLGVGISGGQVGTPYRSAWASKQLKFHFDFATATGSTVSARSFVLTNLCDVSLDFVVSAEVRLQDSDRYLPINLTLLASAAEISSVSDAEVAPRSRAFTESPPRLSLSVNPKRQIKVDVSLSAAAVLANLRDAFSAPDQPQQQLVLEGALSIDCRLFADHSEHIGMIVSITM